MPRFYVFRSIGDISLGDDDPEPHYVFIPEMEVKTGRFVIGSDPLLGKEPETEVEADNLEDAKFRFASSRANAFG